MITDGKMDFRRATECEAIELPAPNLDGAVSVEAAMSRRRSVRAYASRPLTLDHVSQILFAAHGVTGPDGMHTAPSAGGARPLEIYAIAAKVDGLSVGVYHYLAEQHALNVVTSRDPRRSLRKACSGQECIAQAPLVLVISGIPQRLEETYGDMADRLMMIEAGHVAQNVYLQCTAQNLGTIVVGAFQERDVSRVLKFGSGQRPLALMPVGHIT